MHFCPPSRDSPFSSTLNPCPRPPTGATVPNLEPSPFAMASAEVVTSVPRCWRWPFSFLSSVRAAAGPGPEPLPCPAVWHLAWQVSWAGNSSLPGEVGHREDDQGPLLPHCPLPSSPLLTLANPVLAFPTSSQGTKWGLLPAFRLALLQEAESVGLNQLQGGPAWTWTPAWAQHPVTSGWPLRCVCTLGGVEVQAMEGNEPFSQYHIYLRGTALKIDRVPKCKQQAHRLLAQTGRGIPGALRTVHALGPSAWAPAPADRLVILSCVTHTPPRVAGGTSNMFCVLRRLQGLVAKEHEL